MQDWSSWSFYYREDFVIIPTKVMFPNGLLSLIAPYRKLSLDHPEIKDQLRVILSAENVEKVNSYDGTSDKEDIRLFLRSLRVKSQKQLAREVKLISAERNFGRFDITLFAGQKDGSFFGEPELSASIPKAMNLEQTVDFLISQFQG